jgi:hypothetical protein
MFVSGRAEGANDVLTSVRYLLSRSEGKLAVICCDRSDQCEELLVKGLAGRSEMASLPLLLDLDQRTARAFRVVRTPSVVVLDDAGHVTGRGILKEPAPSVVFRSR